MKLIRSAPSALARVSDFDEWFRHPFAGMPTLGQFFSQLGEVFPGVTSDKLAVDVHEDKDAYHAHFEVPGVKKEDIKIELDNGMLTVTAEKRDKSGESESSCTLTRAVSVPGNTFVWLAKGRREWGRASPETCILKWRSIRMPFSVWNSAMSF